MGQQTEERIQKVTTSFEVVPCLQCGSNDIELGDYGYTTFNVAKADCKGCGRHLSWNCGMDPSKADVAKMWNAENDPEVIMKKLQDEVKKKNASISHLAGLINRRMRFTKPQGLGQDKVEKIFPPDPNKQKQKKK